MGLDNGICIKRTKNLPTIILKKFDSEWRKKYNYNLEVAYWRKCWNVRSVIYHTIKVSPCNDSVIELNITDIKNIIKVLRKMNKKNWENLDNCFWEWKDFKRIQRRNLRDLRLLYSLMRKNDQIQVYFYDSF